MDRAPAIDERDRAAIEPRALDEREALISSNERFALLYPEKRPFFLEGVELLQTPDPEHVPFSAADRAAS